MGAKRHEKSGVVTRQKTTVKRPNLYRVVMHNDDFTPMDFVVNILVTVFGKPAAEATQLMLKIHRSGAGTAGVYSYDIAISKMIQVHRIAESHRYPLRCTVEKA